MVNLDLIMEDLILVEGVITMEVVVVEGTGVIMVADLTLMEVGTVVIMEVIGVIMADLTPTLVVIMVTVMDGMEVATADLIPIIMEVLVLVVTLVIMEVTMEAAIVADL